MIHQIIEKMGFIITEEARLEAKKTAIINNIHNLTIAINTKINYDKEIKISRVAIKKDIIKLLYEKSKIEIDQGMLQIQKKSLMNGLRKL